MKTQQGQSPKIVWHSKNPFEQIYQMCEELHDYCVANNLPTNMTAKELILFERHTVGTRIWLENHIARMEQILDLCREVAHERAA